MALIERGAVLVGDDHIKIEIKEDRVIARGPQQAKGVIEIAGFGIIRLPDYQEEAVIDLEFNLIDQPIERLTVPEFNHYLGVSVPSVKIMAHDPLCGMKAMFFLDAWREERLVESLPVASVVN